MPTIDGRPNILFIQSDQHSPFVTGCYGDNVVSTPNLDALAARGVIFDNAYCASPICVPSRMSLLTGRMPHENGVWTNSHILDSSIPTFAHSLGAIGYRPVQIGRMHFNGPDQLHGFAERRVGDHGPNFIGGIPADHGSLEGTAGPSRISLEKSGFGQSAYEVHDESVTEAAVEFLESHAAALASGETEEPFCAAIGLMLPHQPFVAREADYNEYLGLVPPPDHPEPLTDQTHPYLQWWRRNTGIEEVSEAEVMRARTAYWALVGSLDRMLGQIFDVLEKHNLLEDTLIIYTTDHGEQVGEHGLWWKQTFYEEAARVPMIVSWPSTLPRGRRCDRVVSQIDLNATLLELVDAPALPGSSGRAMTGIINDQGAAGWDDKVFVEYCTEPGDPAHSDGDRAFQNRMVRQGSWKLSYYHGFPPQLFNLENDPHEMNDLAANPEHETKRDELLALVLEDWDPDTIREQIEGLTAEGAVLKQWAQSVQPDDTHRWNLNPDDDHVDGG
ncbi:MAG: sulfatase-like hydrolase/transferase [Chloroflexi bacterium]|nr:sulfatase-like hydrolase/transferase [Chloroflexota bacterium]